MRKLKLLLTATALLLLGGISAWAQTDVTSTYITNADFSSIDGWTQDHSSQYWSLGNGQIGKWAVANDKKSSTDDTHLSSEYCLGIQCRWSTNYANFTQTKENASLPAGAYTLTFDVQNANSSTSATYNSNFYVKVGETTYKDTKKEWMSGSSAWTTHTISFTIEEATTANLMFSFGYGTGSNNLGSGSTPHLYVSHLAMTLSEFIDPTAIALDDITLIPTATKTLAVSYTPADANHNTGITWTSTNESVATVSSAGVVTAVAAGTTTITATTANSISTTCTVTVKEAPIASGTTDLYLYNEKVGQYLSGGMNWGTQAICDNYGQELTATLSDGKYTFKTQQYNKYLGSDFYLDNANGAKLLLIETTEGSGKYYITQDGVNYLTSNGAGQALLTNVTTPTDASVWTIVSKAERQTALLSATYASPTDATFLIKDQNFGRNNNAFSSWIVTSGGGEAKKAGDNENQNWQQWNATCDINQTVTGLPNGKYVLKAQGFYRPGGNKDASTAQNAKLYAGDDNEIGIVLVSSTHTEAADAAKGLTTENTNEGTSYYVPNSQGDASKAFSAGLYENTLENIVISDGTLKIGAKNEATTGNQWLVIDNFRLYYYGPTISTTATDLPAGAMTADTWYYFDIAIDGDYDLTLTTLNDIVYTTDATILVEDEATVTDNFAKSTELFLTAGRYYVKSSSAQSLEIAAHSFTYEVGAPTLSVADGKYTQTGTFTVTFPSASTNDPSGETALVASSKATVNGEEVALSAVTDGFSLDLGAFTPGTDYAINIPANVYGYAGESMNSAISLTIHTPAIFDGEYCLYDATNKLFLGRGASWGTEAVTDKYGIPFNLVTNADGISSIEFVDWTGVYLFKTNDNGMFTDNASTGWTFVPTTGGYYLKVANGDFYAKVDNGTYGNYVHAVEGSTTATVWTLKTKAERDAIIAAYPTKNIESVITASGITTTAAEFATYLDEYYHATDVTNKIGTATFDGNAGNWTWNATNRTQGGQPAYGTNFAEVWCATGSYTQTIGKANLPAGIYKVTVQGYERRKDNTAATALYTAGYNNVSTYLSANGEQVRFTDWNEVAGKPTSTGAAVTAFSAGEATNVVYVYLDGATDLTLTVKKPNYIWDCWAIFNNFTLTRFDQKVAISENDNYTPTDVDNAYVTLTHTINANTWNTFVVPFDINNTELKEAFGEDVAVAEYSEVADGENSTVNFNTMDTPAITANKPVLLKTSTAGTSYEFANRTITSGDTKVAGTNFDFVGTYAATTDIEAGDYFIASNKLYKSKGLTTIAGTRAYIKAKSAGARIADFWIEGGETTGISTMHNAQFIMHNEVFDLQGRKVAQPAKGLYIKNGKKVVIK